MTMICLCGHHHEHPVLDPWARLAGAVPVPGPGAAVDPLRGPESPRYREGVSMSAVASTRSS